MSSCWAKSNCDLSKKYDYPTSSPTAAVKSLLEVWPTGGVGYEGHHIRGGGANLYVSIHSIGVRVGLKDKKLKLFAANRLPVAMNPMFNGTFRTGHSSDASKRGKVITIPKAGKDPQRPVNLRPITLLSHMTKTFERALLRRLCLFLCLL
ncbi:hypothetical protein EVAR_78611_1 [Eumeta japonica]|uniref:Uncharacterized protein n=1 Tax=Eumeta variegata TaxID=151549 RepID=A0A4C1U7S4_EUMVA|nr:hypothetical protein EVAR_78611_1 [Eumeta japonica]